MCAVKYKIVIMWFYPRQGKTNDWIPGAVFAITALLTGALALVLPETLNRPLPDTIEEIEAWPGGINQWSRCCLKKDGPSEDKNKNEG